MTLTPQLPVVDFSHIGPSVGLPFRDVRLPDQTGRVVDLHAVREIATRVSTASRRAHGGSPTRGVQGLYVNVSFRPDALRVDIHLNGLDLIRD